MTELWSRQITSACSARSTGARCSRATTPSVNWMNWSWTVPSATHRPAARSNRRPWWRTVNENGRSPISTRSSPRATTSWSAIVFGGTLQWFCSPADEHASVHRMVTGRERVLHGPADPRANPLDHERTQSRRHARPLDGLRALEARRPALVAPAGVRHAPRRGVRTGQAPRDGLRDDHRPRHDRGRADDRRSRRHVHLRGVDGLLQARAPGCPRPLLRDHPRRPRVAAGPQR